MIRLHYRDIDDIISDLFWKYAALAMEITWLSELVEKNYVGRRLRKINNRQMSHTTLHDNKIQIKLQ